MSTQTPNARRPRWRRWLKWPLRLGAASLLLLGTIAVFPNQTLNPAVRRIGPWAAQRFGWELQIDRLRGAPWSRWELEGLVLRPTSGEGPLRIERLGELHVSLHRWPWGLPSLTDVREVWLRDAAIQVRVGGATEADSEPDEGASFAWEPETWPRLDLDGVALEVHWDQRGRLEVPDLRLGLQAAPNGAASSRQARLRTTGSRWRPQSGEEQPIDVEVELDLTRDRITIRHAEVRPGAGQVRAEGVWPMTRAGQTDAQFALRWQELSLGAWQDLHGVARAEWAPGEWRLPELQAQLGELATVHGEGLAMAWDEGPRWNQMQGQVVVGGANLDEFLQQTFGVRPNDLGRYRVRARLSGERIEVDDAQLTWHPAASPGPVELQGQGHLELFEGDQVRSQPLLNLQGPVELAAGEWTNPQAVRMQWPTTRGAWELRGTFPDWDGALHWQALSIDVSPPDQPAYTAEGNVGVRLDQGALTLETLRLDWTQAEQSLGRLEASGSFGSLRGWSGDASAVPLAWRAEADCPQLFPLAHFVPSLRRIDGNASAAMEGAGTFGAPTWSGSGQVQAASLRFRDGESWSEVEARWTLEQAGRAEADLTATYGGAPVTASASIDWNGDEPQLRADLRSEATPVLRTPDARLRADCELHLEGTPSAGRITGSAKVVYGRLRHQFDLSGKLLTLLENRERGRTEASEPLHLQWSFPQGWTADIDLTTAEPVPVYSDLGKTDIALEAKVVGRSGRIYPEGSLVIGAGKVSLPGSTLAWSQGVLLFPQGGGAPQIEASGSTRLSGHDITLAVRGDLLQPTLELSSVPYRPQYDLLVLLLTGSLPGGNDLSRATQSLSVYLAKDLLRRWLGSEPSEEEGLLDRLEITTGREVSESGLGTLEAMFRVTGESSQEGRALWITAERDRYEDMNFGLRWVLRPR